MRTILTVLVEVRVFFADGIIHLDATLRNGEWMDFFDDTRAGNVASDAAIWL